MKAGRFRIGDIDYSEVIHELIVFGVRADPEPHDGIIDFQS